MLDVVYSWCHESYNMMILRNSVVLWRHTLLVLVVLVVVLVLLLLDILLVLLIIHCHTHFVIRNRDIMRHTILGNGLCLTFLYAGCCVFRVLRILAGVDIDE